MGNDGLISGFCHSLKWISLSTLSSEIKVLTKVTGQVYSLQQLEEEIEVPDMEPMVVATDSRSTTQVAADPGRHRTMTTHVDRDAYKVREYVRRGRVVVQWCPGDENWTDIFTRPLAKAKIKRVTLPAPESPSPQILNPRIPESPNPRSSRIRGFRDSRIRGFGD